MVKKVFLTRMPLGIPGDISARAQAHVDPVALNTAAPFAGYGLPGKMVSGKFQPVAAAADGALVRGFFVRAYPTQTPIAEQVVADRLRSGYMTVKCNAGTPAAQGAVHVRVANGVEATPIGGIEATLTADTEVIPGAFFTGAKDADGNVEIEFNI